MAEVTVVNRAATATSYVFTGPEAHQPGDPYNVQIQVVTGGDAGPPVLVSNVTTGAVSSSLSAPNNFSTEMITSAGARVRWSHTDTEGDGYEVQWSKRFKFRQLRYGACAIYIIGLFNSRIRRGDYVLCKNFFGRGRC